MGIAGRVIEAAEFRSGHDTRAFTLVAKMGKLASVR